MSKITFEEYKSAIRAQYGDKKSEDVSGILLNPTPAQLRNLCLMRFENSLTNADENVFRIFFNAKEGENLRKAITNFDIGKFKPIISFLRAEKDSDNVTRIELAAILVDFNPRPYSKYLLIGKIAEQNTTETTSLEKKPESTIDNLPTEKFVERVVITKNNNKISKKLLLVCTVLIALFFIGYTVKGVFFPKKECMKWEVNQYVAIDCKSDKVGIGEFIIPIDENLMKLKKLDLKQKLIFFKNDKPLVWYYKHDGEVELFNSPGFHPETGKPLKPITLYIIDKYLK